MKSKSIVTEHMDISAISGEPAQNIHHLVWGDMGRLRRLAGEDGLIIPVTAWEHTQGPVTQKIHDNPMAERLSKMLGQMAFEKEFYRRAAGMDNKQDLARSAFLNRYGRSYL